MAKANKQTVQATSEDAFAQLDNIPTVSGKIRFLASTGMSRGDIAKKLDKRYQHVRNVLTQPLKKTAAE